jgi:predicted dehydrogenase
MKNVLMVGFGSIARKHLQALNSIEEGFNVYALRSKPESTIEPGVQNIYHLEELSIKIDFAIISNPTFLHAKFINLLLAKDIALFIEKPPLDSLKEARVLTAKIAEKGIQTYVACNLRFHPCLHFIKAHLSKNPQRKINEVNIYCGSYLPSWRQDQDFRKVYSANKEMGGGVHLDLFHEIDYAHWLFGAPIASQCVKRSSSSLEMNAIDYANYQLNYNGFVASVILNYYRKDTKRKMEILFEDETWEIDLVNHNITNESNELIFKIDDFTINQTYQYQMQYFVDCLNENEMPMNTFIESIETLKTCLCDE